MDVTGFEDRRWGGTDQKLEFRHRAALELIAGDTVLDLGCGDGLLLSLLAGKVRERVGLDVSLEAVRKAAAKGIDARVHSFDDPLPFADDSFDTVVLLDVLEHVYDPAPLLAEAVRVSKRDIIVGVPNFSSLPARIQTLRGQVPENNRPNKGHVYWFNDAILRAFAAKAGVKTVEVKMNTFSPITKLGGGIVRKFPNLLALSYVALLRKQ